jgi:hypothetical protein
VFGEKWEPAEGTVVDYKGRQMEYGTAVVDWWIIDVRLPSGEVVRSKVYPPRYEPDGWINPVKGETVKLLIRDGGKKVRLDKSDPARSRKAGHATAQQLKAELQQPPGTTAGSSQLPPGQRVVIAQGPQADAIKAAMFDASGAQPAQADVADQLSKLADLRDRGVLTPDEFEAQKRKVLGE